MGKPIAAFTRIPFQPRGDPSAHLVDPVAHVVELEVRERPRRAADRLAVRPHQEAD
jgi:hypothetical protein